MNVWEMKGIGNGEDEGEGDGAGGVKEGLACGMAIGICGLTVGFVGRGGRLRSELVRPGICSATTF